MNRSRLSRFDSLFVRLLLLQVGLTAMFCLAVGGLIYMERVSNRSALQADRWAGQLAEAAGLAQRPAPGLAIQRRTEPPAASERPSLPAPRYAALRDALKSRGLPVQDLRVDGDDAGGGATLWLLVASPDPSPVWLGLALTGNAGMSGWSLQTLVGIALAALLLISASWVLMRRLTLPLERLRQRLQQHATEAGAKPTQARPWQPTPPEILDIAQVGSSLLSTLRGHARERALQLEVLSRELIEGSLARARLGASNLPPQAGRTDLIGHVDAARHWVANLRDHALSDASPLDEAVDLIATARAVLAGFARPQDELDLQGPDHLVWPRTNQRLIERLMANLVDHALKSGRPPVRLEIGVAASRAWMTVAGADGAERVDGPGAVPEGPQALPEGDLGLAITRHVATRLGGELSSERVDGVRRTTVTLWSRPA